MGLLLYVRIAKSLLKYVDDCTDITLYKDVFKLIFEALEQEQHYKMMTGEEVV